MQKIVYRLRKHRDLIFDWLRALPAYYDYAISIDSLESIHIKIKIMKRQANGFCDHDFFILKIYALHDSRYALLDEPNFRR